MVRQDRMSQPHMSAILYRDHQQRNLPLHPWCLQIHGMEEDVQHKFTKDQKGISFCLIYIIEIDDDDFRYFYYFITPDEY